ncbi:MAG: response regulator [Bacteriovorax sp.]|nr:response regulator [Bacteriovorax sp.]
MDLMKILIVDDEPDILELMVEEFTYKGHNVFTAMSGNEAVRKIQENSFDAVVSDFKMPDGNGMVVLKFVNTLPNKPAFFFVSGQADVSVEDCLKAGAIAFFSKPFDLDELVVEVEKKS